VPTTRTLLRFHRYAGLVVAPLIIFFAISGAWQVYRLQQDRKDGSYKAPVALRIASDLHMAEDLPSSTTATTFKVATVLVAAFLAATTLAGIVVALRMTRPRWLAVSLLLVGAAVPPLLYFLAR
jgi:uncharacterized iron-regulated membrane protein